MGVCSNALCTLQKSLWHASGTLPGAWKVAKVLPLHKAGSVVDPNNYRPISILPTVAKLTERVICNQLMSYLQHHCILSEEQHGFRPGHCTESAMLDAVGCVVGRIDQGNIACLTTADTSTAFDSVPHCRLLEKLGWYGIDAHWFRDWLSDRSQRVSESDSAPVTHGVVQGSLLGPILYLLYTNDFPGYFTDTKIVMYADDVQFIHSSQPCNLPGLKQSVEDTLKVAHVWFVANSLRPAPHERVFDASRCVPSRSVASPYVKMRFNASRCVNMRIVASRCDFYPSRCVTVSERRSKDPLLITMATKQET